ncbi:MAG: hypothetical protein H5T86_10935, partial [Armatimonadetes bacterium]|nr:hypothetical protein [Armatimonadota bacterium]
MVAIAAAAMVGIVGAALWAQSFRTGNRVAHGVKIETVEVGGLTADEAAAAVRRLLAATAPQTITVTAGDERWEMQPSQLGVQAQIDEAVQQALAIGRSGSLFDTIRTLIR